MQSVFCVDAASNSSLIKKTKHNCPGQTRKTGGSPAAAPEKQPHNGAKLTFSRSGVQEHAAAEQTACAVHQLLFYAAGPGTDKSQQLGECQGSDSGVAAQGSPGLARTFLHGDPGRGPEDELAPGPRWQPEPKRMLRDGSHRYSWDA